MATSEPKPNSPPDDDKRSCEELLAKVNQLRMELAYLKKLRCLSSNPEEASAAEKAQVVQELRQLFTITGRLKLAKLPYQQQALQAAEKFLQLKEQIRTLFDRHRGRDGYRRLTTELHHSGQPAETKVSLKYSRSSAQVDM
jgi:tRNA G37 N-methylase Trm5